MGAKLDLRGQKFGRWTVLEEAGRRDGGVLWKCQCECGTVKDVRAQALRKGESTSCGCYNREVITKHGMGKTRLHGIWVKMRDRCLNPESTNSERYFHRGIKICDEWANSFEAFRDWALANGYTDELSIDRIDNNGNYEPNNCRWATRTEQGRNKRNNVMLTYNGETHCLSEWAEITHQNYKMLHRRKKLGWSDAEILLGKV